MPTQKGDIFALSPMESTCYTILQPVTIGSLITSSSNILGTGYPVSAHYHHNCYSSDDSGPPHSPESVYEEDLSDIQEVLQHRMSGRPVIDDDDDDDDDDASVMFDFVDLAFLDHECSRGGSFDMVSEKREECPTVIVRGETGFLSHFSHRDHKPSPYLHTTTATTHSSQRSSASAAFFSLHYGNDTSPIVRHDDRSCFPPTPSPSPSPHLHDPVSGHNIAVGAMMEDADDDDDDAEYKPYCDSRRGAKKNLLWKFLLWVLDNHSDLAQWTDVRRGVFKFVDTARISNMWGQRKHKKDMTFEKLSRGIRHYYKRGLMERMSNTRLVYKFNWEKVPKRFRKA